MANSVTPPRTDISRDLAGAPHARPERVLLIQLRRLGDVTLSTALLEDLHQVWPGASLEWLVESGAAPLLEHHPLVHRRLVLEKRHAIRLWRPVRARHYDCVIDVQSSSSTAILTWLSGAPLRAGWDARGRGWAYTHKVPRQTGDSVYVVRDRQRLLAQLGIPAGDSTPRLYLTPAERSKGEATIRDLTGSRSCVGMVLSTTSAAKDWEPEKFAAVASALRGDGVACVVFRAPDARRHEEAFRAIAGDAALFAPLGSLRALMAGIAACAVFVSGDTGPAHIATALGVPRVTVYGPTSPLAWTPESPEAVAVRDPAARCVACLGRSSEAHSCLQTVTPNMVLGPIRALLHRRGTVPAGNRFAPLH